MKKGGGWEGGGGVGASGPGARCPGDNCLGASCPGASCPGTTCPFTVDITTSEITRKHISLTTGCIKDHVQRCDTDELIGHTFQKCPRIFKDFNFFYICHLTMSCSKIVHYLTIYFHAAEQW